MKNNRYWRGRQVKFEYGEVKASERTAKEVARHYAAASADLNQRIEGIFERFATKNGLSEADAKRILSGTAKPTDIKAICRRMRAMGFDDQAALLESPAYQFRIKRLQDLQEQIDQSMKRIYDIENQITTAHYVDRAKEFYNHSIWMAQRQAGFQFTFAEMDEKMLDDLVRSKWSGTNYSNRIWSNTRQLAQEVKQHMVVGMLTGKTEQQMAAELSYRYQVGAYKSRRLIRTESAFVSNAAQGKAYEECGIERYEYIATLDARTDEGCGALDGKVFPIDQMMPGTNAPPMHPFCRCTTAIYLDDDTVDALKRRARDPKTGKNVIVPASTDYRQWAKDNGLKVPKDKPVPKPKPKPSAPNIVKNAVASAVASKATEAIENHVTIEKKANIPITQSLDRSSVDYNGIMKLEAERTFDEIVNAIGGGDRTSGSCASVALAYIGQRHGYDVLDFRGGESMDFFSSKINKVRMFRDCGADMKEMDSYMSNLMNGKHILDEAEAGKEYYLSVGRHAAIVRRTEEGKLQYLELQSERNNGWNDFGKVSDTLKYRFGCSSRSGFFNAAYMTDIDSVKGNEDFLEILGYVNTNENQQLKGVGGHIR